MGWLMGPIYTAISWILLRWHWVWDHVLPDGRFLGTTWDWVLAIVFLVITVRIILFPIFVKQIRSQRAMQALAPKVKELQQKYKGDQQTLREEMMKLYQQEKVNPLMGCLPLFLQIPVFLGLFHVLKWLNPYDSAGNPIAETQKTLYGWTIDKFDSAAVARLFNAPVPARFADTAAQLMRLEANGVTVKIVAGFLVLIMMITTFLTSRQMILKTGWSQDPQQRMIQKLMLYGIPFSLLLSGWYFPIGVIIYWVTQNLFSLGQQFWVLHKYPPPITTGNIPMKTGRTAESEGGFLARFLQVKPATPKTATRTGFLAQGQTPTRSGVFRRRSAESTPAPEPRSTAPRPGAKPVRPGPTPPVKPDAGTAGPAQNGSAAPSARPGATPGAAPAPSARPAKKAPNGQPEAKPKATGGTPAGGTEPTGERAAGNGGAPSGAGGAKSSASARAGAPRGKSSPKKAGTPRKGQPNRKGGAKR